MRNHWGTQARLALAAILLTGTVLVAQSANTAATHKNDSKTAAPSAASGQKGKSGGSMQGAQTNPLYKDNPNQGTNPLFEGRDATAKGSQPAGSGVQTGANGATKTVEYKDPEDMTTRYRPGNNKTTKVTPAGTTTGAGVVEYKDGEDGTMHTRPDTKKPN